MRRVIFIRVLLIVAHKNGDNILAYKFSVKRIKYYINKDISIKKLNNFRLDDWQRLRLEYAAWISSSADKGQNRRVPENQAETLSLDWEAIKCRRVNWKKRRASQENRGWNHIDQKGDWKISSRITEVTRTNSATWQEITGT